MSTYTFHILLSVFTNLNLLFYESPYALNVLETTNKQSYLISVHSPKPDFFEQGCYRYEMAYGAITLQGVCFKSVWSSYLQQLQKRPVITKCVTSFFGFSLGDILAQSLSGTVKYDPKRTMRMAIYGGVIMGPLAHNWFNLLDKFVFPGHPTSPVAIVAKAALDQLVQAPFGLCLFYAYQETMQGRASCTVDTISEKLLPTLFMTWKFWPLAHLINFSVIPLEQRILYVNAVSVIYTCLLSQMATQQAEVPRYALEELQ
eukprot:TRINITY_DN9766_c0_g1_i2.p2 TRINITY_DN9766_c0_g1~~TRINITY_DN9766_c0_g1_i2.p2  ORF type:complete len:259 (+),score=10.27 TRINITY_DN9766_c0_g1_i2:270-1046(+)